MFRRRPDPRELASVLHRLERLQIIGQPAATGWLPPAPPAESPTAAPVRHGWRARLRALVPARLHVTAFDPGRRGVAVLLVVAVVGASGGAWYFLRAAPHVQPAEADPAGDCQTVTGQETGSCPTIGSGSARSPTESASPTGGFAPVGVVPSSSPSPSKASELVVDVVGKVAKPGVFTLPPGSRIVDAIAAAGGALPHTDLTALDLARKLSDGQEIFVGVAPPSGSAAMSAGGVVGDDTDVGGDTSAVSTDPVVDINSATQAELETLPGVGAVTAQKILAWRTQHGRFTSVTQLQQVSGVGPAKYAVLAGRVKV
ncbi:MAG TPA: ComEA family DNA-binding protein [Acidothermaceae bacterium]